MNLVMNRLHESFTFVQLEHAIEQTHQAEPEMHWLAETTDSMHWLARENYRLRLPPQADISEMVVFPQSDNESMGIEDLRLVRFVDDDGAATYYGTYSAYNGSHVLPQLIETSDFHDLHMHTLNGSCVRNKGLALFPRRIGGHYCMCSRLDGENLFIMYSDIVEFWETAELLQAPKHPWEFMQIGNCGSPLETEAGWLLLTHGVGPMRSYCIGAMLLDLDTKIGLLIDGDLFVGHFRLFQKIQGSDRSHRQQPCQRRLGSLVFIDTFFVQPVATSAGLVVVDRSAQIVASKIPIKTSPSLDEPLVVLRHPVSFQACFQ